MNIGCFNPVTFFPAIDPLLFSVIQCLDLVFNKMESELYFPIGCKPDLVKFTPESYILEAQIYSSLFSTVVNKIKFLYPYLHPQNDPFLFLMEM
jgi:hypothetical protein